jgi:hypothetical protein
LTIGISNSNPTLFKAIHTASKRIELAPIFQRLLAVHRPASALADTKPQLHAYISIALVRTSFEHSGHSCEQPNVTSPVSNHRCLLFNPRDSHRENQQHIRCHLPIQPNCQRSFSRSLESNSRLRGETMLQACLTRVNSISVFCLRFLSRCTLASAPVKGARIIQISSWAASPFSKLILE